MKKTAIATPLPASLARMGGRLIHTAFVLLAATLLAPACGAVDGASVDAANQLGGEGDPCYPNATCDGDLVCLSDLCVRLDHDAAVADAAPMDATPDAHVPDAAPPDVVWTGGVNVTADGNNLKKTSGADGWNAGAVSTKTLLGDGFAEWSPGANAGWYTCGLSHGDSDQRALDIDFGIEAQPGSTNLVRVRENGVLRATGSDAWVAGDVFRVQVAAGVVTYWHNGSLLYTSVVSPAFPLRVDSSIWYESFSLEDVVLRPTS